MRMMVQIAMALMGVMTLPFVWVLVVLLPVVLMLSGLERVSPALDSAAFFFCWGGFYLSVVAGAVGGWILGGRLHDEG